MPTMTATMAIAETAMATATAAVMMLLLPPTAAIQGRQLDDGDLTATMGQQ
jgi:hypothetical protein